MEEKRSQEMVKLKVIFLGFILVTLLFVGACGKNANLQSKAFELEQERFELELQLQRETSDHELDNLQRTLVIKELLLYTIGANELQISEQGRQAIVEAYSKYYPQRGMYLAEKQFFEDVFAVLKAEENTPIELAKFLDRTDVATFLMETGVK